MAKANGFRRDVFYDSKNRKTRQNTVFLLLAYIVILRYLDFLGCVLNCE